MITLRVEIKEEDGDIKLIVYIDKKESTDKELMQSIIIKREIEEMFENQELDTYEQFRELIITNLGSKEMRPLVDKIIEGALEEFREKGEQL